MACSQDKWQDRDIEKLIKLIRVHTCLWNSQSEDYKNYEARDNALTEISSRIGVHKNEVRKKYRNLRTQYIREIRNSKTRGYLSRWIHFNALKFLSEGQDTPNGLWDPLNSDDTQDEMERLQGSKQEVYNDDIEDDDAYAEEFLEGCEETIDDSEANTVDINQASVDSIEFERSELPPAKKQRLIDFEIQQNEAAAASSHERTGSKKPTVLLLKAPKKQRDEYTIFGEHVANELRILKNKKGLQNSLKCAILQAILDVNKATHEGMLSL